jgi:hypothetical protein
MPGGKGKQSRRKHKGRASKRKDGKQSTKMEPEPQENIGILQKITKAASQLLRFGNSVESEKMESESNADGDELSSDTSFDRFFFDFNNESN